MKKILIIPFFLSGCFCVAQKPESYKGHCGLYYKSMDDLYKQKKNELKIFAFKKV